METHDFEFSKHSESGGTRLVVGGGGCYGRDMYYMQEFTAVCQSRPGGFNGPVSTAFPFMLSKRPLKLRLVREATGKIECTNLG